VPEEKRGKSSVAKRDKGIAKWHTAKRAGRHSKRGE